MAPTRSNSSGSQNKAKNVQLKEASSVVPGVQKMKSSIRQTRRLLAKDNLAADVRIETERRLKSLESDLVKAERTRKERNMAVKYHKVKFFERQKVCRKIKHVKKELVKPETTSEQLPSLRESIFSHRIDLNYILHYPKNKKYVSLFPPESAKAASDAGGSETDRQRAELRRWVKAAMDNGEMDAEPEMTMDKGSPQSKTVDWEQGLTSGSRSWKKRKQGGIEPSRPKGVPGDVFFEASDNDDQDQSVDS